ncbi:MAG TPA: CHAT domain-containing protein [Planctomycetota bacterium]|nr:CHAT domain-containing protein [Planctomycetota bacterium]
MAATALPDWLGRVVRAQGPARRARARDALAARRPWEDVRKALVAAVLADPVAARTAIGALRAEAVARREPEAAARLRLLEGRAVHRGGGLDEALELYVRADRELRAAGLADEARAVGVARVDALATAGRVEVALRLATRLAREIPSTPPSSLAASLAVNRGNALRLRGDLDRAAQAYEGAARDLDALGNVQSAAVARLNAGVALLEAGEVDDARARFAAAAEVFRARGAADLLREARYDLAWADAHAGRLGEAIRALAALADEHREAGLARREALCRMDLADALRRAGDLATAEREAVRAAAAFEGVGARAERAEALWFAASAAASLAPARATAHARAARRAATRAGRTAVRLRCDVLLADLAARRGRPIPASTLRELATRARSVRSPALSADIELLAGDADLAAGRRAQARRRFERVRRASAGRPWARLAAETGLARADAADPRRAGTALRRLRRVARVLDEVRSGLPGAWLRTTFLAERLDPYLARVDLLLARDRPADRREAVALLDALAARRFLAARPPDTDPRLRRARARLEAIYDRLARGEGTTRGGEAGGPAPSVLERRARAWERAVASSWRRRERADRAAPGDDTEVPVPARLPDGVGAVHLWRRGARVRGLVRVGDDVGPCADLGPVDDVASLVESLRLRARRWALARAADPSAADPAGAERVLADLARRCLDPLHPERWPREIRVVADPTLPDLPWELLPLSGARLGERHRVLRVPAVSVAPREVPRGEGTVVLAVDDSALPGVRREVEETARAVPDATLLVGAAATRAALSSALRSARVVHVAGHGWDAAEAPPLAGIRLADGWFSAADLPVEGVGADLVLLAACRTGRESGAPGIAWGGLVTALLAAGARRVVWTADDVEDAAAARLTTLFHRVRSSADVVAAFGDALARTAALEGHPGAVLAFRMSGVPA